jgi:hypothetical protein
VNQHDLTDARLITTSLMDGCESHLGIAILCSISEHILLKQLGEKEELRYTVARFFFSEKYVDEDVSFVGGK